MRPSCRPRLLARAAAAYVGWWRTAFAAPLTPLDATGAGGAAAWPGWRRSALVARLQILGVHLLLVALAGALLASLGLVASAALLSQLLGAGLF